MKTNYHTHTQRCRHAQGSAEDYVRSALEAGVSVLGFSDHAPFPDFDFGYRMPIEELEDYFAEVDRLAEGYASDIRIEKSLEIEYLPQYRDYYEMLYSRYHVDYLLLGEHFFREKDGSVFNITTQAASTEDYLRYAHAVEEALETGLFQMVAHADIFTMSHLPWDHNCDAATDIILDAVKRTGTILEFNANGLRRGIHDYPEGPRPMYPHRNFWAKVPGSGIPVIVGSDCHNPTQVWDERMLEALGILNWIGITPFDTIEQALR